MTHPLWKGSISFGLVNIPVALYPGESRFDVHFRMLDSRNHAPIHYERINEETGEIVPWEKVVKAYQYEGDQYVIVDDKELTSLNDKTLQTIEILDFVAKKSIDTVFYDKPYFLVPDKRGVKGYVLLREILQDTEKVGIARVLIRTREYLAAVLPYETALVINILRYSRELRSAKEFDLPIEDLKKQKISNKEIALAKQLVDSMTVNWNPERYKDDYQLALHKWLEEKIKAQTQGKRIKKKAKTTKKAAASNVLDFMSLLKQSLDKKTVSKKPVKTARKRKAN